jgi:2-oxoglutarate ferredoxin oxidoreductase subunit beta
MIDKEKFGTKNVNTWCPGCPNFLILEAVKRALSNLTSKGYKQEDFVSVTGIGCHAKMYDYLNISGFYGLHGRVLPVSLGIKLGNPNLKVIGFAGDGDTYAEGMAHFVHAFRYNSDMTFVVHDNQAFSLTAGQATPTSQQGYVNKAEPLGEFNRPVNPIKLALASGATFVARCNAMDVEHTAEVLEKAIMHKGFSYVEMMQKCLIFNKDMNDLDGLMYKVEGNKDMSKAMQFAEEWDYNSKKGKIPVGIFYQKEEQTLEEKWPQLKDLMKQKKGWVDSKK